MPAVESDQRSDLEVTTCLAILGSLLFPPLCLQFVHIAILLQLQDSVVDLLFVGEVLPHPDPVTLGVQLPSHLGQVTVSLLQRTKSDEDFS